jgi:hypothetical protein
VQHNLLIRFGLILREVVVKTKIACVFIEYLIGEKCRCPFGFWKIQSTTIPRYTRQSVDVARTDRGHGPTTQGAGMDHFRHTQRPSLQRKISKGPQIPVNYANHSPKAKLRVNGYTKWTIVAQ